MYNIKINEAIIICSKQDILLYDTHHWDMEIDVTLKIIFD